MIVYRRFAVRRYAYGGSGIGDTVGSLLSRYATKAMLAAAAKAALRASVGEAKRAIPHLLAHKLATPTIAKAVTGSQEPQSRKSSVDTGGIDINALIDRSAIVLD